MDISVSSNFERYLYYLADCNSTVLAEWFRSFEKGGTIEVSKAAHAQARSEFSSYSASKHDMISTMTNMYQEEKYLLCPHTATAAAGIRALHKKTKEYSPDKTVILATAHPAKFEEAVDLALGKNHGVPRPPELEILFSLDRRRSTVANDVDAVKSLVKRRMIGAGSSLLYSINASTLMTIGSLGFMVYSIFAK